MTDTAMAHKWHCGIGEYEGVCKYGDADCPAVIARHIPQSGDGLVTMAKELWDATQEHLTQLEAQIAKLQADGDRLAGALDRIEAIAAKPTYPGNNLRDIYIIVREVQALTEWKDRA